MHARGFDWRRRAVALDQVADCIGRAKNLDWLIARTLAQHARRSSLDDRLKDITALALVVGDTASSTRRTSSQAGKCASRNLGDELGDGLRISRC